MSFYDTYSNYKDLDFNAYFETINDYKIKSILNKEKLDTMDFLALFAGLFVSVPFMIMAAIFILMSRLYSYRQIRLKKYPVTAFFIVFIFQGGFVYLMAMESIMHIFKVQAFSINHLICMMISSFFMGSMYPLTQIYQHESDRRDGIISLSAKLGYSGTFLFSGILFGLATSLLVYYFLKIHQPVAILLFSMFITPVALRMAHWFKRVRIDPLCADYDHTMQMNRSSAISMNLFFSTLVVMNITMNYL
jgi:1,4-dihydroxy-2-naphthoate octaprenyltransferase